MRRFIGYVFVAVCLILVFFSNTSVFSLESETQSEEFDEALLHLSEYRREAAYVALSQAFDVIGEEGNSYDYMELLSYGIEFESYLNQHVSVLSNAELLESFAIEYEKPGYEIQVNLLLADILIDNDIEVFLEKMETAELLLEQYPDDYYQAKWLYNQSKYLALYNEHNSYLEAISTIQEAINLLDGESQMGLIRVPLKSYMYMTLSDYYLKETLHDEAIKALEMSIAVCPKKDVDTLYLINSQFANTYTTQNNFKDANHYIEAAKTLYPIISMAMQNEYPYEDLLEYEAYGAYFTKDYEVSSKLFYELFYFYKYENVSSTFEEKQYNAPFRDLYEESREEIELIEDEVVSLGMVNDSLENENEIIKEEMTYEIARSEYLEKINNGQKIIIGLITLTLIVLAFQQYRLFVISNTDTLTKLYNRNKIITKYEKIKRGKCCLAIIDLDHFKKINDTYGHLVGDEVLVTVAQTLKKSIRSSDHIGRYGGEEFLLIINTSSISEAEAIVKRTLTSIEEIKWRHKGLKTTASIGLVHSDSMVGDLLLREADEQLYKAKDSGRNCYCMKIV